MLKSATVAHIKEKRKRKKESEKESEREREMLRRKHLRTNLE